MSRTVKRILFALVIIVVLGLLVPPFVNVNRYRGRINEAISNGMGRPATIGQISLRLLPQPGFVLENLVVADDPAFSAEPLLRADEVTASLRLSSLWRGRLEIARLSLKYPSLNLVVTPDNRLNLEALLARAAHTPTAPTTAKRPEARARFPYIEAEGGRINFKRGLEKQVFALTDTDFALWSPWEDEWRMRIASRPVRTDVAISDTGELKIDGSFHRADNLLQTPVNINFSLDRIQLGQLTKLISGRDRGWRGGLNVDGKITGQAGTPKFTMHAALDDFRRYDIVRGEALRLDIQCSGEYVSSASQAGAAGDSGHWLCNLPLGSGSLLTETTLLNSSHEYSVRVSAKSLPMNSVVAFARHAKRDLPEDLSATGVINGAIDILRIAQNPSPQISGEGSATGVTLKSSLLGKDLVLGDLAINTGVPVQATHGSRRMPLVMSNSVARLNIRQFPIAIGGPVPANVNGWIARDGYGFDLAGEAEMSRLLQVARTLGIGVPKMNIFGSAHVQVELAGHWRGFTQPTATGTASLKNVRAEVPGIASPVRITSALATLAANDIRLQSASGSVEKLNFNGSAIFPRHCEADMPCISRFEIQADELDVDALNRLVNPRLKSHPWYKMFGGDVEQSLLASAQATGRVSAKRLVLGTLIANHASADFQLNKGDLQLNNVRADVLGGAHTGQWSANFKVAPPAYKGSGTLSRAALAQVAALTHDPWGTGTFTARYDLTMKGWTLAELERSAQATATVGLRGGSLRHIALDAHGSPLRVLSLDARLSLAKSTLRIDQSRMQTPNGIYDVSGTATLDRTLEFTLQRGGVPAYTVTGTLEKPQVTAAPTRQAEVSVKP